MRNKQAHIVASCTVLGVVAFIGVVTLFPLVMLVLPVVGAYCFVYFLADTGI